LAAFTALKPGLPARPGTWRRTRQWPPRTSRTVLWRAQGERCTLWSTR